MNLLLLDTGGFQGEPVNSVANWDNVVRLRLPLLLVSEDK